MQLISLVVPVYNEEEMLPIFFKKALEIFKDDEKYRYEFVIVNDGSKDKTLDIIKKEAGRSKRISYLSFSKNYGQEAAVEAGLKAARGEAVIPIDCDFQDPPEVVFEMLKKYEEGYEVVNAKRQSRDEDSFLKKKTAGLFYKITNKIAGKKVIEENVCFFRLLSRRVVDHINALPEASRVIRAEVPYVGFKTAEVLFSRVKREAGKTKYNYRKLMGVASKTFSAATPNLLSWPFVIGLFLSAIFGVATIVFVVLAIVYPHLYSYFLLALIVAVALFAVGLISLILSIYSIYIKNIYYNTTNRPNFYVEESYTAENALLDSNGDRR